MTTQLEKIEILKSTAKSVYGDNTDFIFTRGEINELKKHGIIVPSRVWSEAKIPFTPNRALPTPARRCDMFNLAALGNHSTAPVPAPAAVAAAVEAEVTSAAPTVANEITESLVPARAKHYVRFGNYTKVVQLIKSGVFFPTLVTGLSGNGKTMSIEQACAETKREFIRVNITSETDQDDLIGGFRLKNGETVWHDGPVIAAMKRGAVLLLDEFDLGSDKIMALQSIMEGKPYFIKKTSQMVHPAPGFQIFLTANTKGQGDSTGRFVGARIINEAMLDRIKLTLEQGYPTETQEKKIVTLAAERTNVLDAEDKGFIELLIKWVQAIRTSYFNDEVDSFISTRRAVSIVEAYFIFGKDREFAARTGISRFNEETIEAFMKFYTAIDEKAVAQAPADLLLDESVDVDGNPIF